MWGGLVRPASSFRDRCAEVTRSSEQKTHALRLKFSFPCALNPAAFLRNHLPGDMWRSKLSALLVCFCFVITLTSHYLAVEGLQHEIRGHRLLSAAALRTAGRRLQSSLSFSDGSSRSFVNTLSLE